MESPWDQRYAADRYFYGTEPNAFLKECAPSIPRGGRVLCLAEGEGRNAVYLATQGFRVTGVDSSWVGLEKARTLAMDRGVHIEAVLADLQSYVILPGYWDAIVSVFCHLPPPLRSELHWRCVHGLRRNGVFILEGYTPKQLDYRTGGPQIRELLMRKDDLMRELRGLRFERAVELERAVVEGEGHTGQAAVVQLLGVKP